MSTITWCCPLARRMSDYSLDETDRRLLELLQDNARYSAINLAELIGVSDNTIHNRIDRLEEQGIITEYSTSIDHRAVGLEFHFLLVCTVPISEREAAAEQVVDLPGVLGVTELMTGQRNLQIRAVGARDDDITRLARKLDQLGIAIDDEVLVRAEHATIIEYDAIEGLETD